MASTYEPIATTTITGSAAPITFSSIPSTYTDLVLIFNGQSSRAATSDDFTVQLNSDTAANYSETQMQGNGTTASSSRGSGSTMFGNTNCRVGGTTGAISNVILNLNNYVNSTTYKTVLARLSVTDSNATTAVGLWRSTVAITTIKISTSTSGAFTVGSTATLYGIKAA
jgi:hypothetical protein